MTVPVDWTPEQAEITRQMRLLGHDFRTIADQIGVAMASTVQTACEANGWTVDMVRWDAEQRRVTEGAVTAAAATLTNQGLQVERLRPDLFRVNGNVMRAALLIDAAERRP